MKTVIKASLGAAGLLTAAVIALYAATGGQEPVAALVTGDPALPSQRIDGISLHLRIEDGPPGAPTIVVLHGGAGGDFRSLLALSALSDTHAVVFYDQRGAGLSERVAADRLTLDGYLAELDAVLDLTSPDRPAILIGHSWGAMLASAYLAERPERVDRAVLIEPGYLDATGRAEWDTRSRAFMSDVSYGIAALMNGFRAAHVTGPDAEARDDFLIGRMVAHFANHAGNPYHCGEGYTAPGWRFGALASRLWLETPGADLDRIARGTGFQGPILFLAGACNDWTGAPLQARHAARFSDARLQVIPDAGHDVVWDNPGATMAAIRGFLAGPTSSPEAAAKSPELSAP